MSKSTTFLKIIDTHTGGEPTRIVVEGCPDLGNGTLAQKRDIVAQDHDWIRTSTVLEPRGFEAMVGAILTEPHETDCIAGVIFYNNDGYLKMCIHGTIGLAIALKHMGLISTGSHRIDTPAGVVTAHLHLDGSVSVENVPSYRYRKNVVVDILGYGSITGDIAWGGNWFFLIDEQGPEVIESNLMVLSDFTIAVKDALREEDITGKNGEIIDHIETFGPPANDQSDSRNFIMCPGGEYDRSPCGTGTSAKLACLYDAGELKESETWKQSSILNTIFTGTIKPIGNSNKVIPTITGNAWVNGETKVIIDPSDPFAHGLHF